MKGSENIRILPSSDVHVLDGVVEVLLPVDADGVGGAVAGADAHARRPAGPINDQDVPHGNAKGGDVERLEEDL